MPNPNVGRILKTHEYVSILIAYHGLHLALCKLMGKNQAGSLSGDPVLVQFDHYVNTAWCLFPRDGN